MGRACCICLQLGFHLGNQKGFEVPFGGDLFGASAVTGVVKIIINGTLWAYVFIFSLVHMRHPSCK